MRAQAVQMLGITPIPDQVHEIMRRQADVNHGRLGLADFVAVMQAVTRP